MDEGGEELKEGYVGGREGEMWEGGEGMKEGR